MSNFQTVRLIVYLGIFIFLINFIKPYSDNVIDDKLLPHYKEFLSLVENKCDSDEYFHPNVKIEFKDLPNQIIGLCATFPEKFNIFIDRNFWDKADELARFQVFAHESFHCMFFLDHINNTYHFMAPNFYKLSKKELYKQINELLEEKCK